MSAPEVTVDATLEQLERLTKDLKTAASTLKQQEVRFLVDTYYMLQKNRIRAGNQVTALAKSAEPHALLLWIHRNSGVLENNIKLALSYYSDSNPIGQWAESITGIGPVISAGLLAHIDIAQAPTVGHIWRFAGLDPTVTWNKAEKRPWNASLKTLCWKIGESFVKVSSNKNDYYGKVWLERKAKEVESNEMGLYTDQASKVLGARAIKAPNATKWYKGEIDPQVARWWRLNSGKEVSSTPTIKQLEAFNKTGKVVEDMGEAYEQLSKSMALRTDEPRGVPMLPPAHIHARSKRYAVKLFLSHWHWVAYEITNKKKPPMPYIIEHGGHTDFKQPPNWNLRYM